MRRRTLCLVRDGICDRPPLWTTQLSCRLCPRACLLHLDHDGTCTDFDVREGKPNGTVGPHLPGHLGRQAVVPVPERPLSREGDAGAEAPGGESAGRLSGRSAGRYAGVDEEPARVQASSRLASMTKPMLAWRAADFVFHIFSDGLLHGAHIQYGNRHVPADAASVHRLADFTFPVAHGRLPQTVQLKKNQPYFSPEVL